MGKFHHLLMLLSSIVNVSEKLVIATMVYHPFLLLHSVQFGEY